MSKLFYSFLSVLLFFTSSELSFSEPYIPFKLPFFGSSPNPVGSGARAIGMGGAFIAIADDATAASWNPGGLIQLIEPEISIAGTYLSRTDEVTISNASVNSETERIDRTDLNYLSFTYPFSLINRNMVISVNYQHLYDFSRNWDLPVSHLEEDMGFTLSYSGDYSYQQDGGLSAIGTAFCVQILRGFSLGIILNIWDDDLSKNSWGKKEVTNITVNMPSFAYDYFSYETEKFSFKGLNYNIGFLWRSLDNRLSIGCVFKAPFTGDIIHTKTVIINGEEITDTTADEKLDMPMSYGAGICFKFSDNFKTAVDIYHTKWGNFIYTDLNGVEYSFITGVEKNESYVDSTTQFRIGCEYLIKNEMAKYVIPVRLGLFYDPVPNRINPDDVYGLSIGTGIAVKRFSFDLAYQYRTGKDMGSVMANTDSLKMKENKIFSSLILYF